MPSYPLQIKVHTTDGADHIVSCDERGEFDREETRKTIKSETIDRVVFPEGLLHTGKLCENCAKLVSVTLPEGLKVISFLAFYKCINLPSITIPASVGVIDVAAFEKCESLKDIFLPKNVQLGASVFANCTSFLEIYIPPGVTTIPPRAFEGCSSLWRITFFPKTGLKMIEWKAFKNCVRLENVDIPEGVTKVLDEAFEGCDKLASIIFPSTLNCGGYGTDIVKKTRGRGYPLILLAKYETGGEQYNAEPSFFDTRYFEENSDDVKEKIKHIHHDHRKITDEWIEWSGPLKYKVSDWETDKGEEAAPKRARTTEGTLSQFSDHANLTNPYRKAQRVPSVATWRSFL